MNKVVLIGCGNVGMAYAFNLVTTENNVDELVLIDINQQKAQGEALDLLHAASCSSTKMNIKAGCYEDCNNASIICICAGRNQEIGETRNDLIKKNTAVFKDIIQNVEKTNFDGIYLIATNPVDVMTYVTYKLSGFNPNRVLGSGTTLDTARLKYIIANVCGINPKNIHAFVMGEHGDTEFIPWSCAMVGYFDALKVISENDRSKILYDVRNSAYDIINKKGNTAYGIGICLANITNAILNNTNEILTISCYNAEKDVYIGTPAVINRYGVKKSLDIKFTKIEQDYFNASADEIRSNLDKITF